MADLRNIYIKNKHNMNPSFIYHSTGDQASETKEGKKKSIMIEKENEELLLINRYFYIGSQKINDKYRISMHSSTLLEKFDLQKSVKKM